MKAVKRILFVHGDDSTLGPIFKAMFRKEVLEDPVLSTANLQVESVGVKGGDGDPLVCSVSSVLESIGIQDSEHTCKNIWLHQDLVHWADLILVPSLFEEDVMCLRFAEACSKTECIEGYCSPHFRKDWVKQNLPVGVEVSIDQSQASAQVFKLLLPELINKLKDTYTDALIARGIGVVKGTNIGKAFVAKQGRDLERFEAGTILVADRYGAAFTKDIDKVLARKIISKFVASPVFVELDEYLNIFSALAKGKSKEGEKAPYTADGLSALNVVLRNAKAAIFSRSSHRGEIMTREFNIPCVSACVGATECIATGQFIVVDAERGEVYDASLLRDLT